ncbi:hypothetical protein JQ628_24095 [Bradyrhizobium lablabi]|uniref:hypothetical protein n=1 Tax=Bradyrhizobium lablabi TaxID=722472 RepID=UPI001BAD4D0A|nr:hypothetical protein [Bradyrhizobium lablabi]MBR1124627.1 hypothetical protein [Bradyrhizobium lablabi]
MVEQGRSDESKTPAQTKDGKAHPILGALRGTVFIPPGVDLTEPADPEWADIAERKAISPAQR